MLEPCAYGRADLRKCPVCFKSRSPTPGAAYRSHYLGLMLASFFLHQATALWDVSYAVTRREVTPIEQHAHSFLEMVPLMALSFIALLHWPELRAFFGLASEPADMSIRVKDRPLPIRYVAGALGANVLFEALPYLEELYRTLRASHGRLVPDSALH